MKKLTHNDSPKTTPMHIHRLLILTLIIGLGLTPLFAVAARTHDIGPDDYFTEAFITGCTISPDGHYVAFTEMRWEPPAEGRNTDLWVVDTRTSDLRRLTFDPARDENPQWSADSKTIYFTSKRGKEGDPAPRNGATQVWSVSVDGGPEQSVTGLSDGLEDYQLSQDGKTLYYLISAENVAEEWHDLHERFSKLTYGSGVETVSELWKLDLRNWRAEKLADEKRFVKSFAVSPDQAHVAMITTPGEADIYGEGYSRVDLWDVAARKAVTLPDSLFRKAAPSPYGWLEGLTWSSDSKRFAFREDFDGYPARIIVAHLESSGIVMQLLARPGEFSLSEAPDMHWIPGTNTLCFMPDQKARVRLAAIEGIEPGKQGALRILTPGDVVTETFHLSRDGKYFVVVMDDSSNLGDLYLGSTTGKGGLKRLTDINPQIAAWKLPHIQIVSWKGADGDLVEGILELPYDYTPGKLLPLHVALHGGPTSADYCAFTNSIFGRGLWAGLGWAVFAPNYRGSTGYGDKFMTDLIGHENDRDVTDVLTGVDMLVARGIADSTQMAISGWSNGGYLTNCIITRTNRFKVASSGAGVLDMAMQWGTEDTPGHVLNYTQGLPWEKTDAYRKSSPLWDIPNIQTPLLIHQGEDDPRVPAVHERTLFRALSFYRHVPSELVLYPNQSHNLTKLSYRKAKLAWDIAWFDRYVLGKDIGTPPKPAPAEKAQ
jgi:dipeptidyl aminopeptidase/acylaminoacyl peptidase